MCPDFAGSVMQDQRVKKKEMCHKLAIKRKITAIYLYHIYVNVMKSMVMLLIKKNNLHFYEKKKLIQRLKLLKHR